MRRNRNGERTESGESSKTGKTKKKRTAAGNETASLGNFD